MLRRIVIVIAVGLCFLNFLYFFSSAPNNVCAEQYSSAECVMEVDSRRILYQEHGDIRLPMASTTKIVTALCVLESDIEIDKEVSIPKSAVGIEGSSVYLKEGDKYSVKELLYGLMLRSGNDCAVALAETLDGSIHAFSSRMDDLAQASGALNSRFANPHGLPTQNHYTTAVDLSLITARAMQNSQFCEIVKTTYYAPKNWTNKNKMLTNYQGAIGVKTGYTKEAGRCLVTAAERNGMRLIATVLNSPNMYERTKTLLDDAFSKYINKRVLAANEVLSFDGGQGVPLQDYYFPMLVGEENHLEVITHPHFDPKNNKIVGQFEIYLLKRLLFCGNLYKL